MAPSGLQVGLSSYTYPWAVGVPGDVPAQPLTATQLVQRAARLGVPVVQLADNLPLHLMDEKPLLALRDVATDAGVRIEVGTRGIEAFHLERYLELAVFFGSPILRVITDAAGHEPAPAEIVSLLREHELAFRRAEVVLAIENHDRLSSVVLAAVVEALGTQWVGICLDTVNSLGALEGPAVVIETLGPLAVNVHVKDFDIVRSHANLGFDVRGCPVGAGRLDLRQLFSRLGDRMPVLTAVIELWTPHQDSLADTVALERDWAEQSVQTLSREVLLVGDPIPTTNVPHPDLVEGRIWLADLD